MKNKTKKTESIGRVILGERIIKENRKKTKKEKCIAPFPKEGKKNVRVDWIPIKTRLSKVILSEK